MRDLNPNNALRDATSATDPHGESSYPILGHAHISLPPASFSPRSTILTEACATAELPAVLFALLLVLLLARRRRSTFAIT